MPGGTMRSSVTRLLKPATITKSAPSAIGRMMPLAVQPIWMSPDNMPESNNVGSGRACKITLRVDAVFGEEALILSDP